MTTRIVFADPGTNTPPISNAGPDQTVDEGATVNLDGTASSDPDSDPLTYSWNQTSGTAVTLSNVTSSTPSFTAPSVGSGGMTLTFELTVGDGNATNADTVNIQVSNLPGYNYLPAFSATGSKFFNVTDNSSLHISSFSLAAWFKTSKNYFTNGVIANRGGFGSDVAGQNLNYGLWIDSNEKVKGGFETSPGADMFVTSPNAYSDNLWHYAVVTYDGSTVRLYIDGNPVGNKATAIGPDTAGNQPFRIGANSQAKDSYFTGSIDEVRLWSRAVTAQEVADQYNVGDVNQASQLLYFDGVNNNLFPISNAGPDQSVDEDTTVNLDGTSSSDPESNPLTYSWNQTSGTAVTLSNAASSTPSFTAPSVGSGGEILTFELTVNNGNGDSAKDTVSITVNDTTPPPPNSPPIANAGIDQTVNENTLVTLSGIDSSDPDSDPLIFSWSQTSGSPVILSGANTPSPSFTAPNVGASGETLTFALNVTDNHGAQSVAQDTVNIQVSNLPGYNYLPAFSATGSKFFNVTDNSSLHISSFSLAAWFKTSKNYFTNGVIANKGGFGSDVPSFNLNYGLWMDSNEKIKGGFETSPGADMFVTSPNAYSDNLWHYAVVTYDGSVLRLYIDGVSVGNRAAAVGPDTAGNQPFRIGANSQAKDSYFTGSIDEVRLWSRAVTAQEVADQYNVGDVNQASQLLYFDGVENNYNPAANAGTDQTVNEGTTGISLNGMASVDNDGVINLYQWQQISGLPVVILNGSDTSVATFDAPQLGDNTVLTFRLTVVDDDGDSGIDDVSVTLLNNNTSPLAVAGTDQTVNEGTLVTLNGTESSDPDGSIASYLWEQTINGTAQVFEAMNGNNSAIATFEAPDVTSNTAMTFRLTVTDNNGASTADEVIINVLRVNQPPAANAGANQTALEGSLVTLNGTASADPDEDQMSYQWTQTGGTAVVLNNPTSSTPSFTAPDTSAAQITLTFKLVVNDPENANSTAFTNVFVTNNNAAPTANAGPDQTKNEKTSVTLTGSGNDTDAWPQPLTYQWEQIDATGYKVSLTPTSPPSGTSNLAINKVLRGSLTLGSNPTDVTISSVDMTKAFVMCYFGTDNSNADRAVTCKLTSSTTLRIEAGAGSSATSVQWSVVEFMQGAVVQRGETAWTSGTSSQNIPISAVDLSKTFVLINTRTTSNSQTIDEQRATRAALTSTTNLQLTRAESGIAVTHVWQVIQLDDTVVQSGTTTLSGVSSATASITPVDLAETFLVFSTSGATSTNGVEAQYYMRGRLTSASQVTFDRNSSTNSATVSWFAVSVDRSSVQSGTKAAATTETILDNTINAVNLTRTSSILSTTVGSSGTADQDSGSWTTSFTSTTNLRLQRQSSQNVPSNTAWFVVEWPVALPSAPVGGNSVIFTTPEIPSGSIVLTFRLKASDGDKFGTDDVNVTVNNLATSGYHYPASFVATGSNSISVPDNPSLRVTKFSLAAWFKTSTNYGGDVFIVNKGGFGGTSSGNNLNYGIWMDSSERINAGFETAGNTRYIADSNNGMNNNQWHYVVMTYDPNPIGQSSRVRLYVDGVQVDTSSNTNNNIPDINGAYPFRIGANSQANNSFFIGDIDEVRLWNRVLSDSEIASQYNAGTIDINEQIIYMDGVVANQNPSANAGLDKAVDEDTVVTLSGTSSTDPDGNQLSFSWTQLAGPAVVIDGSNSGTPSFMAPHVGSTDQMLTFQLTVGDGLGATSVDTINVLVQGFNFPPVANAGPDQTVDEGVQVTLNGSASSDQDDLSLSYSWTQLSGPSILFDEPSTQNPIFLAPNVAKNTVLSFLLTVNDGRDNSTDTVNITIVNIAGGYLYSPAFKAKGNNHYNIPDSPSLHLQKFSVAAWFKTSDAFTNEGMIVNKGGVGSESPGQNMNYGFWMTTNGNLKAGFELVDGADYFINPPTGNVYNDGEWHYAVLTYDGAKVKFYVDGTPVGSRPISLATGSPDNTGTQPLRIGANSQGNNKYFKGDIDEVKIWNREVSALEISDQYISGIFLMDGLLLEMNGVTHDNTPVANAGPDQTIGEDTAVMLTGSASSDPDGTAITYQWSQISGPVAIIPNPNIADPVFTTPILAADSVLVFSLLVSDGTLNNTDTVSLTVINTHGGYQFAPPYTFNGSQSIELPDDASLRLLTFSVSTWFKTNANYTTDAPIVNKGGYGSSASAGNNLNYGIWMGSAEKVRGGFESSTGFDVIIASPNSYSDGFWHYASLTCDCPTTGSSILNLYVDGQLVATTTVTNKPDKTGTYPLRIGAHEEGSTREYFIGEIDDVRVWNRVLTPQEVSDQYLSSLFNTVGQLVRVEMGDAPVAEAGDLQLVAENSVATLNGTGTTDPDNDVLTYAWTQISGPAANITNGNTVNGNITTPDVSGEASLYFKVSATDDTYTATDTMRMVVYEPGLTAKVLKTPDFMNDLAISIDNAQTYFYAGEYYFRPYTSTLFNNLEDAIDRGVEVKVTISPQQVESSPSIEQDLQQRGIPYRITANHAKVVAIDDEVAYVGSANMNFNGLENNWELTLKTTNPNTIKEAKEYILSMFETGIKKKDLTDLYYERFANGPEYLNMVVDSIKNADSVKILNFEMTYSFDNKTASDTRMMNEVRDAYLRGAELKILVDDMRYGDLYGGKQFFAQNNIPHKVDNLSGGSLSLMHAKTMLINNELLFIGSQNWNEDSIESVGETSVITRNPQAIAEFQAIFDAKWNQGIWVISP